MQVSLLKNLVAAITGQHASGVVDFLYDKKNVNEFLIAKKLKLTINQTRNVLYKLADEGIVSFSRKKDKKKGGWYTYFWTLNVGKGLLKFREHLLKNMEGIRHEMNLKKTVRFYHCPNCGIESNEESALLYQYTCPECGEVLQLKDKSREVENMEKELVKLGELLNNVEQEIGNVVKKEDVAKARKNRAEAKKKSEERALKKKKREKELKKLKIKGKTKGKKKAKMTKKARGKEFNRFGKRLSGLFKKRI